MKQSAGLLLYREAGELEVFLVHPGGPFWKNKDDAAWSIPKGEFENTEDPLAAAKREFKEETGIKPRGEFIELEPVKLKSGKIVYAWALAMDLDLSAVKSNHFEMEWPPRSGKMQQFPEIDKGGWFGMSLAEIKINVSQIPLLKQLVKLKGK